jgi:hypothetical protein
MEITNDKKEDRNFSIYDTVSFLFLALIIGGFYGDVIHLWWTYDDTQILKHAILYHPREYFLQPRIWQEFTPRFLTPVLLFSFDIDIFLFDLKPQWFYIHQLIVIWLCSIMLYLILRKWVQRPFAFLGAALFLLGSPVAVIAQQLMTRHYVDGLFFTLISLYLFIKSLEESKIGWAYGSALAYALSMAAKEVYVPFAFLLIALPCGEWKHRLKYLAPHFVLLSLYVGWRFWMLGTPWGGYGGAISAKNAILLFYNNFFFGQKSALGITAAIAVLAAFIIFLTKNWKRAFFILWIGVLILFPILPVAHFAAPRFFLVVWIAVVFFLSFIIRLFWHNGLTGKILSAGLLVVVILHTMFDSRSIWRDHFSSARQLSAEGMFIFSGAHPNDLLRRPAFEGHYFKGIQWLNCYHGITTSGLWFYDDIYLCEHDLSEKRVWQYVLPEGRLVNITDSIEGITKAYCGRIKYEVPLTVSAIYSNNTVSWKLGPYINGYYAVLTGDDEMTRMELPPEGSLRVHFGSDVTFRIRYESPEGWITYSPKMIARLKNDRTEVNWKRTVAEK